MLSTHGSVIWPLPCLCQPFDSPFLIIYPFLAKPRALLMDRSECFQMFVYLLCSHYKMVYSGAGSFPVALFPLGGGKDLMEVWWEPPCTLSQQLPNQRERARGGLLYFRYFALKAVSPQIFAIIVVQPFQTPTAHREQLDGGPEPAGWRARASSAAQRPSCCQR